MAGQGKRGVDISVVNGSTNTGMVPDMQLTFHGKVYTLSACTLP